MSSSKIIIDWIKYNISSDISFDKFIDFISTYQNKPCHTIREIYNKNNKKIIGDLFEEFCKLYLIHVRNIPHVWLLNEVPDIHREKLSLGKIDLGIDLIGFDNKNYYAIQSKYRTKNRYKSKNVLGWKMLSTFQGLVAKTGPYKKHIVMTNADYIRHVGKKSKKDLSICLKRLQNIKKLDWLKMISENKISENRINNEQKLEDKKIMKKNKKLSLVELRQIRLNKFDKKITNNEMEKNKNE